MSTDTVGHRTKPYLQTALKALGNSQITAFPLTNNTRHEFVRSPVATGAILPVGCMPSEITIYNSGANGLTIYPVVGGTINSGMTNAPAVACGGMPASLSGLRARLTGTTSNPVEPVDPRHRAALTVRSNTTIPDLSAALRQTVTQRSTRRLGP